MVLNHLGHLRATQITKDARHISDEILPGMLIVQQTIAALHDPAVVTFETRIPPGEPVKKKLVLDIQH